jgi:hypothetical protein
MQQFKELFAVFRLAHQEGREPFEQRRFVTVWIH